MGSGRVFTSSGCTLCRAEFCELKYKTAFSAAVHFHGEILENKHAPKRTRENEDGADFWEIVPHTSVAAAKIPRQFLKSQHKLKCTIESENRYDFWEFVHTIAVVETSYFPPVAVEQ